VASMYPAPQVVVIDDDAAILSAVCDLLNDARITAEGCPSGSYAYKYILHRRPRLVILDVIMPGVDGVEVFHQLRADPFMQHTAVAFFTGDIEFLQRRFPDYEAHGAIVLHKPLDGDALIEVVSRALRLTND
jgi:DNA-binding response OmpR family regulator